MEQKGKKFEELNRYERAMTNASLEQRLEAMAKDLEQMALALKISVYVDATFHDWGEEQHSSVNVSLIGTGEGNITRRDVRNEGDLFGIIEEALTVQSQD